MKLEQELLIQEKKIREKKLKEARRLAILQKKGNLISGIEVELKITKIRRKKTNYNKESKKLKKKENLKQELIYYFLKKNEIYIKKKLVQEKNFKI